MGLNQEHHHTFWVISCSEAPATPTRILIPKVQRSLAHGNPDSKDYQSLIFILESYLQRS